jgi:hypothetical protein
LEGHSLVRRAIAKIILDCRSIPGTLNLIEQTRSRMQPQSIIIHERLAYWSRQIRPRFRGCPIRWSETRSSSEFVRSASQSTCPIFLIDLADRPGQGLEDLGAGLIAAPMALSLVLDPRSHDGLCTTARELGATLVLPGLVVPPGVVALLQRWLPVARQRSESDGWSVPIGAEPDFWGRPSPLAAFGPFSSD